MLQKDGLEWRSISIVRLKELKKKCSAGGGRSPRTGIGLITEYGCGLFVCVQ